MGFIEKGLDFAVEKGGEAAERAMIHSAKVAVVAGVLGIGSTTASLGIMAAEHAPEIFKASQNAVRKLVR